ncbi:MAG: hypothetical protein D6744_09565, partial [Planctomycetota bacterium]
STSAGGDDQSGLDTPDSGTSGGVAVNHAPQANAGGDRTSASPIAHAGDDIQIRVGQQVTLDGNASEVFTGSASYAWSQISGPDVTLNDADQPIATFTPVQPGEYVFELTVTDGKGREARDQVIVTVSAPPSKTLPVRSTFDSGDEGWRLDGGAFSAPTAPNYSADERYVWTQDAFFAYWIAPAKFHGNFSNAYGKRLRFEVGAYDMYATSSARVILAGGGVTLLFSSYDPAEVSPLYSIRLDVSESWINADTRQRASEAEIRTVLSDISQLAILAGDSGFSWLDQVSIGDEPATPVTEPITFDFAGGDQGWRVISGSFGTRTRPFHNADAGYLWVRDAGFAFWRSPESLRGDFRAFYGRRLVIDESWDDDYSSAWARVLIYGGGLAMWTWFPQDPGATIRSFGLTLDETETWTVSGDNDRPTRDQMIQLLSDFQGIRILTGDDGISRLDRVVIGAE